jgi:large subunit ribosomal protein L3
MKFLLAKKVNMTQVFEDTGKVSAVTVLKVGADKPEDMDIFKAGDEVTISGTSKGKGFQGVVKRHGFGGGRRTHGQKHSEREPGSIGGGGRAGGRVPKGKKMAGRMGSDRVTIKNLKVVRVFPETQEILISGAIPGRRGSPVEIKAA